jgi:hypothetical protein
MKLWLLPNTVAAQQALAIQRRLGSNRSQFLSARLAATLNTANLTWMGSRGPEYLLEAGRYVMLDFALRLMRDIEVRGTPPTDDEAMAILRKVPFVIPRALPSGGPLATRWNDRTIALMPNDLAQEYDSVLARIQKVKAKRWLEAVAFGESLRAALPGMPLSRSDAEGYLTTRSSDIALDYLLWKHFRPQGHSVGRDSVKKMIRLARTPGRLLTAARRDLKRHYRGGLKPPRLSTSD